MSHDMRLEAARQLLREAEGAIRSFVADPPRGSQTVVVATALDAFKYIKVAQAHIDVTQIALPK